VKTQLRTQDFDRSHSSQSSPGCAALTVERVSRESAVTSTFATNPMKLLTPRARGKSVWAYTSSFGGGLVAGDQTRLDLRIGEGARCFIGTQASTKIYRNPSRRPCTHATRATLETGSLLVFAPDPVQPFAGSTYEQRQEFRLAPDAGLALVDWFSAGRTARGERWEFDRFQSRNEVFAADDRTFLDSILLDSSEGSLHSLHRTGRFNCFALLLLIGAPLKNVATKMVEEISARPVERRASLVTSASPVRDGALLRVAGEQVEHVGRELHRHLTVARDFLGDDPWSRKW
jgi:urease accessory protein